MIYLLIFSCLVKNLGAKIKNVGEDLCFGLWITYSHYFLRWIRALSLEFASFSHRRSLFTRGCSIQTIICFACLISENIRVIVINFIKIELLYWLWGCKILHIELVSCCMILINKAGLICQAAYFRQAISQNFFESWWKKNFFLPIKFLKMSWKAFYPSAYIFFV